MCDVKYFIYILFNLIFSMILGDRGFLFYLKIEWFFLGYLDREGRDLDVF